MRIIAVKRQVVSENPSKIAFFCRRTVCGCTHCSTWTDDTRSRNHGNSRFVSCMMRSRLFQRQSARFNCAGNYISTRLQAEVWLMNCACAECCRQKSGTTYSVVSLYRFLSADKVARRYVSSTPYWHHTASVRVVYGHLQLTMTSRL